MHLQREGIYPVLSGVDYMSPDALNTAFKLVSGAFSLGFPHTGHPALYALCDQVWFHGAAVVPAALLWGIFLYW